MDKTLYPAVIVAAKKIARREREWQRVFWRAKYKIVAAILCDDAVRFEKILAKRRKKWPLSKYRRLLMWILGLEGVMNIGETAHNILTDACKAVGIFCLPLVGRSGDHPVGENCDGCPSTVDD